MKISRQQIGYSCILYIVVHTILDSIIIISTEPEFNFDDLLALFYLPFMTILIVLILVQLIHKILKIDNWLTIIFVIFTIFIFEYLTYLFADVTFLSILFNAIKNGTYTGNFAGTITILNNYLSLVIAIIIVKMITHFQVPATNSNQSKLL